MPLSDPFGAAFDAVAQRFVATGLDGGSVALTAAGRGEGVTTVAIGVATALARRTSAKVLLVDGTPLGQRAAQLLGHGEAGAVALETADGADFAASVLPVPGLGFDLLVLNVPPRRDDGALSGWSSAWKALRAAYADIIVDAGSLRSEGPHLWKPWVANLALVIDTTRTTRDAMVAHKRGLDSAGLQLAGFILNKRKFHLPAGLYSAIT